VVGDPDALGEFQAQNGDRARAGRQVEVFDRGRLRKTGQANTALDTPVVAVRALQVHRSAKRSSKPDRCIVDYVTVPGGLPGKKAGGAGRVCRAGVG